jgi:hypothetical protein
MAMLSVTVIDVARPFESSQATSLHLIITADLRHGQIVPRVHTPQTRGLKRSRKPTGWWAPCIDRSTHLATQHDEAPEFAADPNTTTNGTGIGHDGADAGASHRLAVLHPLTARSARPSPAGRLGREPFTRELGLSEVSNLCSRSRAVAASFHRNAKWRSQPLGRRAAEV